MSLRKLHIRKYTYIILIFLPDWSCIELQIGRVFLFEFFDFILIHNLIGEHAGKAEIIEGWLESLLIWELSEAFIDGGCEWFAVTVGGNE